MNEIVVSGLSPAHHRRFKVLAKQAGNAQKAARIAFRIGLLALDHENLDVAAIERAVNIQEAIAEREAAARTQPPAQEPAAEVSPERQPSPAGEQPPAQQQPAGQAQDAAPPTA